jgi:hypothetical protein
VLYADESLDDVWICGAGGGFGGGDRARPPDLGVPFKAGFASISDAGLEAGHGAVREVMAAPIVSPNSTSTFSPMSSEPTSMQCVMASISTASFAAPASNAGAGGEDASEEVTTLGGGRGGRGRGGMGWMGGGVAAPTNRPPTHVRPPSVAMRSSIVSPSPGGGSTILGEHMRSGGSSVFERAPSGCSCVCVRACVRACVCVGLCIHLTQMFAMSLWRAHIPQLGALVLGEVRVCPHLEARRHYHQESEMGRAGQGCVEAGWGRGRARLMATTVNPQGK